MGRLIDADYKTSLFLQLLYIFNISVGKTPQNRNIHGLTVSVQVFYLERLFSHRKLVSETFNEMLQYAEYSAL